MQFRVLGSFEVSCEGRLVELGSPKQRAVLAALVICANRVVSLDRLIDQLWGGQPPAAATGSLQAYVANLRRVLEPGRAPRAPARVLVTRPPGYALRVDPADVDAGWFEQLTAEGQRLLAEQHPAAAHEMFGEALRLWRGPALAEMADYEFAAAEIVRLDELRLAARQARAEAALALGRHAEAVPDLERLVREHPWRERPRELLMLALYRCARQAEALEVMTRTRREFAEELGIDPGPGMQELNAAILRQDPKLAARPLLPPLVQGSERVEVTRPVEKLAAGGLIGRVKPLAAMRRALDESIGGRGRTVLVAGEPGIGKTRLLQELATAAEQLGVEVVWGRCHDSDAAPAFWPWTQVLRALIAAWDPEGLAVAARAAGPHLAPLAPELVGAAAAPAMPAQTRLLLYDAVTRLLLQLAAARPLLLVLEDLHWADPPSLELITYLAGHLAAAPALLAGTFRDEAARDEPLATMLAAVARESATERLHLAGLLPEEVGQIVTVRTGVPVDEALAVAVHERTDGNPFFVTELTRLLSSEGRLGDPANWPVPENVRDVLRRRAARLPEQAVSLLTIGAVAGRIFDVEVLQRVSGLDEDRALTAVEAAVITGLLVEHPEFPGRYRFVHVLVRETLYDGLPGIRRARLHARIGEAIQVLYGQRDVDALAHHFWHAGTTVRADQALTHVQRAAEAAEQLLAFERAIEQLRRAVTLIGRLDPGPDTDERELEIQFRLGSLLLRTRGYANPDAANVFARVCELARALSHTAELTEALRALASFRMASADFPTSWALGEELLTLGHENDDREQLLAAHHILGVVALHQGDHEQADSLLADGIRLADEIDDISLFIDHPSVSLRGFRAQARWLLGDRDRAAALRDEALALAAGSQQAYTLAYALLHAAQLAVYQRDLDATRRWAGEGIALCGQHGFGLFAGACRAFTGWAAALQGEPGAGRIRAALEAIDASGARMLRPFFLALLAEAELAEGRPEQARRALDEALAEVAATGERFSEPQLRRLQAKLTRTQTPVTPARPDPAGSPGPVGSG